MAVVELTKENFEQTINGNDFVIVDFWAPWCAPCKILAPTINELANEYGERIQICKLNVDENRQTTTQLKIRSIPTVIMMQNGQIVGHFVGVKPKYVYAKAIKELI